MTRAHVALAAIVIGFVALLALLVYVGIDEYRHGRGGDR